jgi:hypothetical protein
MTAETRHFESEGSLLRLMGRSSELASLISNGPQISTLEGSASYSCEQSYHGSPYGHLQTLIRYTATYSRRIDPEIRMSIQLMDWFPFEDALYMSEGDFSYDAKPPASTVYQSTLTPITETNSKTLAIGQQALSDMWYLALTVPRLSDPLRL